MSLPRVKHFNLLVEDAILLLVDAGAEADGMPSVLMPAIALAALAFCGFLS